MRMHTDTEVVSDLNSCVQPGRGLHKLQQVILYGFNILFYCFKSGMLAEHISCALTYINPTGNNQLLKDHMSVPGCQNTYCIAVIEFVE
jgi:hypothetical protein